MSQGSLAKWAMAKTIELTAVPTMRPQRVERNQLPTERWMTPRNMYSSAAAWSGVVRTMMRMKAMTVPSIRMSW